MVKTLDIGIRIPLDIVTDTNAILAKKGAGKTYTGSVLAEEMIALGQRVVIVDPTNAWWGLRAKADGSPGGLPVVIFGGDHADYPLDENMGGLIADLIVDGKVGSCILCTKGFESDAARVRFLLTLGQRLFFRNREPLHLFLDEADDYLPQNVTGDVAKLVNVWAKIVKQGRLQGLGVTMITQRAAVLNKNVLTQISTLFVLQTVGPQDIKAISDFIRAKGGSHDEMLDALPRLKKGEAYVYSPEFLQIDPPQKMQVRLRRTFNSSATPKVGERRVEPKALAPVDVERLKEALAVTVAKAKADDPKTLRARIIELERAAKAPTSPKVERVEIEVSVLSDGDRDTLARLPERFAELGEDIRALTEKVSSAHSRKAEVGRVIAHAAPVVMRAAPTPVRAVKPRAPGALPKGELAVLTACAQHEGGCDRQQLTALTGYKRSTRDAYVQRMITAGLVELHGSQVVATREGLGALGPDFERLPTGDALLDHWLRRLPEGERTILSTLAPRRDGSLVTRQGGVVSRDALSDATGYKRSTRDAYIQRLATRKLVTLHRDGVAASDLLFG